MGAKSKTTSTISHNQQDLAPLHDALGRARTIADAPTVAYGGQPLDLSGALGTASALQGFSAPGVSASSYAPSLMTRVAVRDVRTGAIGADAIAAYANPYQQQVVDSFLTSNERQRRMAISQGQGDAILSGAGSSFGGSRHGVADSQTNARFGEIGAQTTANLLSGGWQSALAAAQADADRRLTADQANAGHDYNVLSGNAGYQNQASQFNAQQMQAAALANQQAAIEAAGVRSQAAGLFGNLAGQQYSADYGEFVRQQQDPLTRYGLLADVAGQFPVGSTTVGKSLPGALDWANLAADTATKLYGAWRS